MSMLLLNFRAVAASLTLALLAPASLAAQPNDPASLSGNYLAGRTASGQHMMILPPGISNVPSALMPTIRF